MVNNKLWGPEPAEKGTQIFTTIMQNKPNFKTEVRKQKTEDSKIRAKSTPKLRLSVPPNRTKLNSVALMD